MKENQNKQVLEYMREHGSISQRDAVRIGCYRLSARIHDLRQMGYVITSERKTFFTKAGHYGFYAEYKLVEE